MRKIAVLFSLLSSILFISCSSPFYEINEKIIEDSSNKNSYFITYDKEYIVKEDGTVELLTHTLLKLASDAREAPNAISEFDGAIAELLRYDARLLFPNGTKKTYKASDLIKRNLSSSGYLTENYVYIIPISQDVKPNSILEEISRHKHTVPQLGLTFDLNHISVKAEKINVKIQFPKTYQVKYTLHNSNVKPVITNLDDKVIYTFKFENLLAHKEDNVFQKDNYKPVLMISIPETASVENTWKTYGNSVLKMINNKLGAKDKEITLAKSLTEGLKTDKEKMDAIFNYCQKNIRYEQSYLKYGEFVPNTCSDIIQHKYGDCKDYSNIIYSLGKAAGLDVNLAICYRGRGKEFFDDAVVQQFNHMIVHFENEGKDYWYDGTNRTGFPGITTEDLINQYALILREDNSRLIKINEVETNKILVSGTFTPDKNNLKGKLDITLKDQYSFLFYYNDLFLSPGDMSNFIKNWLHKHINYSLVANKIEFEKAGKSDAVIHIDCVLPNAITSINDNIYFTSSKMFPQLFPTNKTIEKEKLFYYPYYNNVDMNIELTNCEAENKTGSFIYNYDYYLSPGPFSLKDKDEFLTKYNSILNELNKKIKLTAGTTK